MIFKFLKLIVSFLLIAFIAILISETEGNTKIDWLGWGIEIETSYLVLILAFFCLILIFSNSDCENFRLPRYLSFFAPNFRR